jgi:hypothetical protein
VVEVQALESLESFFFLVENGKTVTKIGLWLASRQNEIVGIEFFVVWQFCKFALTTKRKHSSHSILILCTHKNISQCRTVM